MPHVSEQAEIEVRAPAAAAFDVVAHDLMTANDEPEAMSGHRPVDEGSLRDGFRWRQWVVHDRQRCLSDWTVTSVEPPFHLEQAMWHLCAAAKREVRGGERWEFTEREDGSTLVTLRAWTVHGGLAGLLAKLTRSGTDNERNLSLRKRLAYVQFEAERQTATSS